MGDGSYESKKFGGSVTVDTSDESLGLSNYEEALAFVNARLDDVVREDVEYYSDLSAKRDSFIHTVAADMRERDK